MAAIDAELQALKDNLLDMLGLVREQLLKCRKAIRKTSPEIAEEVIANEKKVNMQELAIDRDCENILALYTPVATDLRFVLASLKITNDLERIGDNASRLAKFISENISDIPNKWIAKYNLEEMLDVLTSMLKDMDEALRKEDTKLARKTTKNDEHLNKYFKEAFKTTSSLIAENPDKGKTLLTLFTVTRDLERAGDLTKNIAEELVFHIEARVLKHRKDQS
jgi:phosphate transport system protein